MGPTKIVCGVCGYRINSDLLDTSLSVNETLVTAMEQALKNPKTAPAILRTALAGVPKELTNVWTQKRKMP